MRLLDIHGRPRNRSITRYLVNWGSDSASKAQTTVKKWLAGRWGHCCVVEEFPVLGTRMRVDFINFSHNLAIEVDGTQHDQFNKFFHKSRLNWLKSLKKDFEKEKWLNLNDIKLVRIPYDQIKLLDDVFFEGFYN